MALQVGVTGGIGSGKSFICKIISNLGYPVFHSDDVAKQLMSENEFIKNQIINQFGKASYHNGELNRTFIASQIFSSKKNISFLNNLVHPLVRKSFESFCDLYHSKIIFNEAAILIESGSYKQFDKIILIKASKEEKIKRVMTRDNISEEQVVARMNNQWADEEKSNFCDFEIMNNNSDMILPQILNILEELEKSIAN